MRTAGGILLAMALVSAALLPGGAGAAAAAPANDAKGLWRRMTEADLASAYRLIADNHPGAAAALGDADFQHRLADGYALARSRAAAVEGYGGYAGVMNGFAGAFGDDHIAFRARLTPVVVRWAGVMVTLRDEAYVVSDVDAAEAKTLAAGDTLVSCDGVAAAAVAERRLAGFRGDWTSAARRYQAAPYLLLDTDNPFAPPPARCLFRHQGQPVEVTLRWRDIANADAAARLRKAAPIGQAGMGLREFAGGYWIGLQRLDPEAARVVRAVTDHQEAVRRARLVVVDLRGDGGGASAWGDLLVRAIWGPEYVQAALAARKPPAAPACAASQWRATADNLKTVQFYKAHPERFGPSLVYEGVERQMAAALAAGRPFSGDYAACLAPPAPPAAANAAATAAASLPPSPVQGKVLVLTDASCFSSCLITLDTLRALGAVQAGQATSSWSHYTEVREAPLPSGLGMFSTLQAVDLAAPPRTGPYLPARAYAGDISDTAALETWVAANF